MNNFRLIKDGIYLDKIAFENSEKTIRKKIKGNK